MPQRAASTDWPRFLTAIEAGSYLGLSDRTLENYRILGGGPRFRKIGRSVRYTIADLDAWVEARAFEMTSDPNYPSLTSLASGKKP